MANKLLSRLTGFFRRGHSNGETEGSQENFLYNHRLKKTTIFPLREPRQPAGLRKFFLSVFIAAVAVFPFSTAIAATYLALDSYSGTATTIHASSGGWQGGESVKFFLGSTSGSPVATAVADEVGQLASVAITIPPSTPQGPLSIFAQGTLTAATESNSYYVVPFTPSLAPVEGSPNTAGSSVNLSGSGFSPNENVSFMLNGSSGGSATADSSGSFSNGTFTVPNAPVGTYQLHGLGQSSGADAIYYFYVGGFYPSAAPSTYYLLPGETLSFSGSGFASGEEISVTSGSDPDVLATITAGPGGDFTSAGSFTVPLSMAGGVRNFTLSGNLGHEATGVMVTVGSFNGSVVPSAYFLFPGETLHFSGSGYAPGETVQVFIGSSGEAAATFSAGSAGSFSNAGGIPIPFSFAGMSKTFTLRGQSSGTGGSADITVGGFYPAIVPSDYFVTPGQSFTISGTGFASGETVTVAMAGGGSVSVVASSTGAFSGVGPFTAPFSGGPLHMTATGQLSGVSAPILEISLGGLYPSVTPNDWWVLPGASLNFAGSGFAPSETVSIASNLTTLGTVTAGTDGSFLSESFSVPFGAGERTYTFTGNSSGATASVTISVAGLFPYAEADTYYITPGSTVHITGHGFASGESVSITLGSNTTSAQANLSGNIPPTAITIPFGSTNPVTVSLVGQSSGVQVSIPITLSPFYPLMVPDTWYTSPGTTVHFSGTGFASGESVSAQLNGSLVATATATASGSVESLSVTIPVTATVAHFVFTGQTSGATHIVDVGLSGFTPQVTPSTWYTPAGSAVTFTGSGFSGGETITIKMNNAEVGTIVTNSSGEFTSGAITIPFSATSAHFEFDSSIIHAHSELDISIAALSPGIVLSTYWDQGGQPLTVTGQGFAGGETVTVMFDGGPLGSPAADATGNFSLVTTVPFGPAGSVSVQARGESSGVQTSVSTFTRPQVYVSAELGSYAGAPGSTVTFVGSGYLSGEPVEITTNRTGSAVVHSFTANSSGSFSNSGYSIPSDFTGGPLTLTISGLHSFTVKNIVYYITGP